MAETCDVCGNHEFIRRPTTTGETVAARLEAYNRRPRRSCRYYEAQGRLQIVDGMADIDEVTAPIEAVLETLPSVEPAQCAHAIDQTR